MLQFLKLYLIEAVFQSTCYFLGWYKFKSYKVGSFWIGRKFNRHSVGSQNMPGRNGTGDASAKQ